MKICPFVTQTCILEDKDVLVREPDDVEASSPDHPEPGATGDPLFINPEPKANAGAPAGGETASAVRFIAKAYRGRVECLGELCRFHDAEANGCRFDSVFSRPAADSGAEGAARADAGRALDELREAIGATAKQRDESFDAFSLTLDARSEEIERKIEASAESIAAFRGEITAWKDALAARMDKLEEGFVENRQIVGELSRSHQGIMQIVEYQKRNLEEEGRKRRTSEARRINNAGVLSYHNGQYEKALEMFRKAVEIDPVMTEAYNNLGLTYTEMNEPKLATEAFKKAIEIEPELAAAYNNLGFVFYRLGSYSEAIEMYNEAIGRNKDNAAAYTNLGNAYYKMKRVDEAIEAWKKALEIDPANEKARRNLRRFHAEVK